MEGWIKSHRKTIESELWLKPSSWFKVWFYILCKVSHQKTSSFEVGEKLFNYRQIAENCGVSYDQVRDCVKWLISTHSLTTRKTTRGIFIKVLNYTKYQLDADIKPTRKPTHSPNRTQIEPTLYNKNGRKEKKINKKKKWICDQDKSHEWNEKCKCF